MKYSARTYAAALVKAADGKSPSEQKQIANSFWQIVSKNRDQQKINRVLEEAEKIILKNTNTTKVRLESAEPVPAKLKHEVKELMNKKVLFSEIINPELLAGIKILINDELLIDATAKSKLNKLLA